MARFFRQWTNRRTAAAVGITILVAIAAVFSGVAAGPAGGVADKPPAQAKPPTALFTKTTPAANTASLMLAVDEKKVLGWISGAKSFAGREVAVRFADAARTVVVQRDNTFTWHYATDKPTPVAFAVGALSGTVRVGPPVKHAPSVFFVVDRTVYRPGHELQFAAFLRNVDADGRFTPVANKDVEVVIRSKSRNTVACKLKLTSDAFGRITGEYRFMGEDALDDYVLTAQGYTGKAQVKLAEFRKAKVRLHISGERKGNALKLRLEARDFLNKPIPAKNVQFTAKVFSRSADKPEYTLDAEEFVYRAEAAASALPDPDTLSEEQIYRWTYEGVWPSAAMTMLAQFSENIPLDGKTTGEHDLELESQWLEGKCVVQIEGVLIDENGREQRGTRTIPLDAASVDGMTLTVSVPKRVFVVDEAIPISVHVPFRFGPLRETGSQQPPAPKPKTSLVVMRKIGAQVQRIYSPYAMNSINLWNGQWGNQWNGALNQSQWGGRYWGNSLAISPGWRTYSRPSASSGEMVTAVVVADGKAEVKLDRPGTYDLVAVTTMADGTRLRRKTSCTVLAQDDRTLLMRTDKREYEPGQTLEGELHSRFTGARVLLTLRDSRGIRLWRTIDVKGAVVRFSQHLPADLNYGCSLVAQYVGKDGRVYTTHRNVRVVPKDRMLDIEAAVPRLVEPGREVTLKVKVNRNRPVDLAVSVYDESLLGIAADKAVKIRNFYLADERAFTNATRDTLRRAVGEVTLEQLHARAKKLIADKGNVPETALARHVVGILNNNHVHYHQLHPLLQFAGIRSRVLTWYGGWYYKIDRTKGITNRLADVVAHNRSRWTFDGRYYGDLLVLVETHPSHRDNIRQWLQARGQNAYGYGNGMYNVSGNSFMSSANGSFSVSGQSFISHMPTASAMPTAELMPDTDMGDMSVRRDFSDSAFWNANVRTDEHGEAAVTFKLPDSLTNWRVVVTGITDDMHVGQQTDSFRTYKPIMVWPMIPRVFTEGDEVRLFARVHNRTDGEKVIRVKLKVDNGKVAGRDTVSVRVPPKDSAAVYWVYRPARAGYTQLLMTADCADGSDASLKRLPVVPACSVEQVMTASGFCVDPAKITIPRGIALKDSKLEVTLVPSLAADMVDSLDYLVRYPHGCAEQTMSKFVPAVKVSGMLKRGGLKVPELEKKLPRYVAIGIKKLINYQRSDGGWGWNGNGRTHEMMTPYVMYGLLEAEAAGYALPNETAVQRGLNRLHTFINQMGATQAADRIYCMYVYSMRKPMQDKWWQFITSQDDANALSDYATAMALEMAVRSKKTALAASLAGKLRKRAVVNGGEVNWTTAKFSKWRDDPHEVTAAVLKALVAVDADDPLIPGVLSYFASTKRGKRWNSTKDTAMILFAMCDYLAAKDMPLKSNASVSLALNGGKDRKVRMTGGLMKKVVIDGTKLKGDDNTVTFSQADKGTMYRMVFRYRETNRDVGPFASGMKVTRMFHLLDTSGKELRQVKPGDTVPRGSYIRSRVTVWRLNKSPMDYVLVESPKPSCAEIVPVEDKRFVAAARSSQYVLREDKTHAVLYHHEQAVTQVTDQAVFYAELAGQYTIPPAYAEMMYKTTVRGHSGTFRFKVSDEG